MNKRLFVHPLFSVFASGLLLSCAVNTDYMENYSEYKASEYVGKHDFTIPHDFKTTVNNLERRFESCLSKTLYTSGNSNTSPSHQIFNTEVEIDAMFASFSLRMFNGNRKDYPAESGSYMSIFELLPNGDSATQLHSYRIDPKGFLALITIDNLYTNVEKAVLGWARGELNECNNMKKIYN